MLLYFLFCASIVCVVRSQEANRCIDPAGAPGVCKSIKECGHIRDKLLQEQSNPLYIDYIQKSNAACNFQKPFVCCGTSTPEQLYPVEGCGMGGLLQNRVVGGTDARMGAWPWMALLGYKDSLGAITFKCGGTLITSRHVLTAAQCSRKNVALVRLGEHDTSIATESNHVDIEVLKVVEHPGYDRKDGNNDLAIIYLAELIKFTNAIRPLCLPTDKSLQFKSFVNSSSYLVGWGFTQEGGAVATVLQQLQITVFNNSVCRENYKAAGKLISMKEFNDDIVLCAGSLDKAKDACKGDGGGPLMVVVVSQGQAVFYQIGIVSHGVGCARSDLPGAYTKVQAFTDWIQEKVTE